MSILDNNDTEMLHSMEPMDALSLYSDTQVRYRIIWDCGRAEAAERQRRAGQGEVTNEGYVRTTPHEWFADMAEADPNATVEEI